MAAKDNLKRNTSGKTKQGGYEKDQTEKGHVWKVTF